jgi:translation initiation factor IF-1
MAQKGSPRRKDRFKHFKRDENKIYFNGVVIETLPGTKFGVEVKNAKPDLPPQKYVCSIPNWMVNKSKLVLGDPVEIEIDPFNLENARIVNRLNRQAYIPNSNR